MFTFKKLELKNVWHPSLGFFESSGLKSLNLNLLINAAQTFVIHPSNIARLKVLSKYCIKRCQLVTTSPCNDNVTPEEKKKWSPNKCAP